MIRKIINLFRYFPFLGPIIGIFEFNNWEKSIHKKLEINKDVQAAHLYLLEFSVCFSYLNREEIKLIRDFIVLIIFLLLLLYINVDITIKLSLYSIVLLLLIILDIINKPIELIKNINDLFGEKK